MSFVESVRGLVVDQLARDPHGSALSLCELVTYEADTLVLAAMERALDRAKLDSADGTLPDRWALMALGGYGRGQMCPRSDIDIQLVVPDGAADPAAFMVAFVDELTRARLKLGHGVRTISESLMLAHEEVTFATAALTSRHLAGDPTITETVRAAVYRHLTGPGLTSLLDAVRNDRRKRSARLGETVNVLEPDLKYGVGGLRDAQVVGWLSLVTGRPFDRKVMFAEDVLLKVRMALHAVAAFRCDRLAFEYQDEVARVLGVKPPGNASPAVEVMRQVHVASRIIARRARRHLESATDRLRAPIRRPVPGHPRYVRVRDRLARADGAPPRTTADVADAVGTILDTGLPLEAALEDGFEALSTHLGDAARTDPALTKLLLDLLDNPAEAAAHALQTLHRTGLITAIVPEFEPVIGRIQRDLYHVFTVDEHILRAVAMVKALARGDLADTEPQATRVCQGFEDRRVLSVAVLLHDIGKGYGAGHHERGAELADIIAPRLGLDAEECRLVRHLVRHQADMALICMRRDLSDPRPIRNLARVVGDTRTLDLLYVLTTADWSSVGPDAFTGWHRQLLSTLYRRTTDLLTTDRLFVDSDGVAASHRDALLLSELGRIPEIPDATSQNIEDFCASLPTRYFQTFSEATLGRHYRLWQQYRADGAVAVSVHHIPEAHHAEITVVASDRAGLLARLAGGLSRANASVLDAQIHSVAGDAILDVFRVADPHDRLGEPASAAAIKRALIRAIGAGPPTRPTARPLLTTPSQALPPIPIQVSASNDAATDHSVFDMTCGDREALLFDIATFFRDAGISVDLAFVNTAGRKAHDTFYVVDDDGNKLDDARISAVAEEMRTMLAASRRQ